MVTSEIVAKSLLLRLLECGASVTIMFPCEDVLQNAVICHGIKSVKKKKKTTFAVFSYNLNRINTLSVINLMKLMKFNNITNSANLTFINIEYLKVFEHI